MKIELESFDSNHWTVRSGDRYQDKLCWDEMLGLIARVTRTGAEVEQCLKTAEQHAKSPYSELSTERRREASYTALCGLNDNQITEANRLFTGDLKGRLAFLLGASNY